MKNALFFTTLCVGECGVVWVGSIASPGPV